MIQSFQAIGYIGSPGFFGLYDDLLYRNRISFDVSGELDALGER